jgi:hypothetical protein
MGVPKGFLDVSILVIVLLSVNTRYMHLARSGDVANVNQKREICCQHDLYSE